MEEAYPLEMMMYQTHQVWAFRISRVDNLSLHKTFQGFLDDEYEKIIVSEETSKAGVLHHHGLVAFVPTTDNIGTPHERIVKIIKRVYPDAKGNKCIYVRQSINKTQLLKYTLKEGLYFTHGFTQDFVTSALLLSSSKEGMKKAFQTNLDRLLLDSQDFKTFMANHVDLKVKFNQPLYDNHLMAYFKGIAIRSGELTSIEYVERFDRKIFHDT